MLDQATGLLAARFLRLLPGIGSTPPRNSRPAVATGSFAKREPMAPRVQAMVHIVEGVLPALLILASFDLCCFGGGYTYSARTIRPRTVAERATEEALKAHIRPARRRAD